MIVAVTGGTGFLGSRLTERLSAAGHEVRIVSRSHGYDITSLEKLATPFANTDLVFHLAALVQSRPGPFEKINLLGLENVLKTCYRQQVPRLIYVSSFTVFGPSGQGVHTENTLVQREQFFHDYDRTKYKALGMAKSWRSKVPMNIVFPTVIYGPGPVTEGNMIVRLIARWLKYRLATLPGRGRPQWNFAYVEDVVEGLIRAARGPLQEDFILGGHNASLLEFVSILKKTSGKRICCVGLPDWMFHLGCHVEDWISRLLHFAPLVLPETGRFLLNDWQFSSEKARSHLAYSPCSLEKGLESTYQWMKSYKIA